MKVTGSPTKRNSANAIKPTVSMTRTACARRRRMNAAILREWYPMSFAQKLIRWQRAHGRHDLPWQGTRDPYRIWLSEVMLQQTQVAAVVPYYERFLQRYPSVAALAAASEDDVLRLWSGLGYARGRNLHKAARLIREHGFPRTAERIAELPGVGRSTAAAIAVFAFGERAAILDGNAKRVIARRFGTEEDLWRLAERLLPVSEYRSVHTGAHGPRRDGAPARRNAEAARYEQNASRAKRAARPSFPRRRRRPCRRRRSRGSSTARATRSCSSVARRRESGAGSGASPSAP